MSQDLNLNERETLLLGVCGSIAAYKAADLARSLMKLGYIIQVILTKDAERFITRELFEALTGNPVPISVFDEFQTGKISHIEMPRKAKLFIVAPLSAHTLSRFALGLADDMLTTAYLANGSPVLLAPAMNPSMWNHPAIQANYQTLLARGNQFVEPTEGMMVCGEEGTGKLAEVEVMVTRIQELLFNSSSLIGKRVLITLGPTYEPIDPVRFIGNHSSGKMGAAIAEAAISRGAEVTVISGPVKIPLPKNICLIKVHTASEMFDAVNYEFEQCDVFISTAAVSDYKPVQVSEQKLKKSDDRFSLELEANCDILEEIGKRKKKQIIVGFAAETNDLLMNAKKKLHAKNLDMIAANDVLRSDSGFNSDYSKLTLIFKDGNLIELALVPKLHSAKLLLDEIEILLDKKQK